MKYVLENCRLTDYNTPMRQLIRHIGKKDSVNVEGIEWEEDVLKYVLENSRLTDYNTPMRQLIRHMPRFDCIVGVAESVFNQCMIMDETSNLQLAKTLLILVLTYRYL